MLLCEDCDFSTQKLSMLVKHIKARHNKKRKRPEVEEDSTTICPFCKFDALTPSLLGEHMEWAHKGKKMKCSLPDDVVAGKGNFPCIECGYKASRWFSLINHYETAHKMSLKPLACQISGCDFRCKKRQEFQEHCSKEHPDVDEEEALYS